MADRLGFRAYSDTFAIQDAVDKKSRAIGCKDEWRKNAYYNYKY